MAATGKDMDFSLVSFAPILEKVRLLSGPFDPRGAWKQVYGVYVRTLGPGARLGTLEVRRRPHAADDGWDLDVSEVRFVAGRSRDVVKGTLYGCEGELGTPKKIVVSHKTRPPRPGIREHLESTTRIASGGAPGVLRIRRGRGRVRSVALSTPWTASWCLIEAVQRLPHRPGPEYRFDLLDHWEEPKAAQRLEWYGTAVMTLGGKRVVHYREARKLERGVVYAPEVMIEGGASRTLHAWAQTGAGVVPVVYWMDDAGRLLLVLSGLSAFVLEKSRMET